MQQHVYRIGMTSYETRRYLIECIVEEPGHVQEPLEHVQTVHNYQDSDMSYFTDSSRVESESVLRDLYVSPIGAMIFVTLEKAAITYVLIDCSPVKFRLWLQLMQERC